MASAQHVWELSRAILADEDGYVAVIKVYMDESGTHDGSPYVTVGAYLGKPATWKSFTKEWNARKKPDGIEIYHATDCANQKGEFKGWTPERSVEFAKKMLPVINSHTLLGVLIGIDMVAYEKEFKKYPELRKMAGTPYGCCFQWTVQIILDILEQFKSNEMLAFFHERNNYEAEANASFRWVVDNRRQHANRMTLTFGTKQQFTPLQTADILAYEGSKRFQGMDAGRPPRKAWTVLDPNKDVMTIRRYGKDNMPWFVQRLKSVQEEIKLFGKPISFLREEEWPLT